MNKICYKELLFKSVLAGWLIGFAACIFVQCQYLSQPFGKIIGAGLFSLGLIAVIVLEAYLFTGKIGYVNSKQTIIYALFGLVINLAVAFVVGVLYKMIYGEQIIMNPILAKTWYQTLADGFSCGALIYLAVELYKKCQKLIVVILPVMAFILAGFTHCIATMTYLGMCEFTMKGFIYVMLVVIGNAVGSLTIRFLQEGYKCTTVKS